MSAEKKSLPKAYAVRLANTKAWYAIFAVYLLVLGFLSLNPWLRPVSTSSAFSPDKLDHAFAYGGLAIIVYFSLTASARRFGNCRRCAWMAALAISISIGILIEIAQSLFTVNRTGSVGDAVANAFGAALGYVLFQIVKFFVPAK